MADLQIQDIDFETVRTCNDVKRLKVMIQLLKDEPYYPELLASAMDRLKELSPDSALEMSPASFLEIPNASDLVSFRDWISKQNRIDEEICTKKSAPIGSTAPGEVPATIQANEHRAQYLKTIGKEYFKSQDYSTAAKYYTKAIETAPPNSETQSVCYFNRANCNFQLKLWKQCEKDATCALEINAEYIKALFVRAKARDLLHKFQLAIDDLKLALKLDPENDKISSYLQTMISKVQVVTEQNLDASSSFTRLKIVEVEEDDDEGSIVINSREI